MPKNHLPLHHLSIRVPWHDNRWNGTICKHPKSNASCLFLKRINELKDVVYEEKKAGEFISDLSVDEYPPCVTERGTFLCENSINRAFIHPYSKTNSKFVHYKETFHFMPPFCLSVVPFRWMMKNSKNHQSEIAIKYNIDYNPNIEPELGFSSIWIQDIHNQRAILDSFFGAIVPKKSLCLIYAKHTPLTDEPERTLIGIGFVNHIGNEMEYDYSSVRKQHSLIWDRFIQHSIREDMSDGFILPYDEVLEKAKDNDSIKLEDFVAYAPDWDEFSYAGELVSHDTAIDTIHEFNRVLKKMEELLNKNFSHQCRWLNSRLTELWNMRGPFPGLGPVLTAFGFEQGVFLSWEIQKLFEKHQVKDPFELIDKIVKDPTHLLPPEITPYFDETSILTWKNLPETRKRYLKFLCRMALSEIQAKRFYSQDSRCINNISCSDEELLANPYLFFELDLFNADPISTDMIDKAVLSPDYIKEKYPIIEIPKKIEVRDKRRIRALIISILEEKTNIGHSLLPLNFILNEINDLEVEPRCDITKDNLSALKSFLEERIIIEEDENGTTYQLKRIYEINEIIRTFIKKRQTARRLDININWEKEINKRFRKDSKNNTPESLARKEKIHAIKELAEARVCVLVGAAGTGKTTLLSILCNQREIKNGGILLLAPTGKARVRMSQIIGEKALTLAQFLLKWGGFDEKTYHYFVSQTAKYSGAQTVIVDEASMLTEEQLGALLACTKNVKRFILVGDPKQLPPIGTGRPFVDIVNYLKPSAIDSIYPKVANCYVELTVNMRQIVLGDDLIFANMYNGLPQPVGDDDIVERLLNKENGERIELLKWDNEIDLNEKLFDKLTSELELKHGEDQIGFACSLGASVYDDYAYFNNLGVPKIEDWQIISPMRGHGFGVKDLNRAIQNNFKKSTIMLAKNVKRKKRKIAKPLGSDGIIYGDKVICLFNQRNYRIFPKTKKDEALKYIANGEIGIVTGKFVKKGDSRSGVIPVNVRFSSQPDYCYVFYPNNFSEESEPPLELAYAITIHKSQGSEFKKLFLILPNPCPLLSRELLYTALTRHTDKIIILYQGSLHDFKRYSQDNYSETNQRITNMFSPPRLIEIDNKYFEKNLIHYTVNGILVRSKSEVIIANLLVANQIEFEYEKQLKGNDGNVKYPDFTIEDYDTGEVYYWEHLGMLDQKRYRDNWEKKLKWYSDQGIILHEKGGGDSGTLILSTETPKLGINAKEIEYTIKTVILKENTS